MATASISLRNGSRSSVARIAMKLNSPTRIVGETTSSASWNRGKGLFNDFGDPSYNGDIVHLIAKLDNVSTKEAAATIALEAGIALPDDDGAMRSVGFSASNRQRPRHRFGVRLEKAPEETPENKIAAAQKIWQKRAQLLDSHGEAYLNDRSITLSRDAEPLAGVPRRLAC